MRENENLWDPHHLHKKRNAIKVDSWKNISEEVDRSPEDCQKKWKNLCQSYRKYHRGRKGKSDQGANEGLRITWFAYETIHSFMNDVYKPHGNTDVDLLPTTASLILEFCGSPSARQEPFFRADLNDSLDSNVDIDIETINDEAREQSLQDSGEQADGEDQRAPTDGVPSAENGDE